MGSTVRHGVRVMALMVLFGLASAGEVASPLVAPHDTSTVRCPQCPEHGVGYPLVPTHAYAASFDAGERGRYQASAFGALPPECQSTAYPATLSEACADALDSELDARRAPEDEPLAPAVAYPGSPSAERQAMLDEREAADYQNSQWSLLPSECESKAYPQTLSARCEAAREGVLLTNEGLGDE